CSSVFTARATAEIYTLSLHDALPIFGVARRIENALDMAAVGQDEATVAAEQQGRAIDRVPGRDVIVDTGHAEAVDVDLGQVHRQDRKSTRLNSSHVKSSYAVFCLKKK